MERLVRGGPEVVVEANNVKDVVGEVVAEDAGHPHVLSHGVSAVQALFSKQETKVVHVTPCFAR
jgi:hypothetical protein